MDKENQDPTQPVEIQNVPFDLDNYDETVRSKVAAQKSDNSTSQANGDGSSSVLGKFMIESYE